MGVLGLAASALLPYTMGGFGSPYGFGGNTWGGWQNNWGLGNGFGGMDPREPFSPFTNTATLRNSDDFYLWGAPNEFQASVYRMNPELYPHVYDQYPHPGYLMTRPSWAGGLPGGYGSSGGFNMLM